MTPITRPHAPGKGDGNVSSLVAGESKLEDCETPQDGRQEPNYGDADEHCAVNLSDLNILTACPSPVDEGQREGGTPEKSQCAPPV
jgi:hypothetical protein